MFEVSYTDDFIKWLNKLKDRKARAIIHDRILRIEEGNFGDIKFVANGVSEVRIHYGAGYRLYFIKKGKITIIMLGGGDKSTQSKDIKKAIEISKCL